MNLSYNRKVSIDRSDSRANLRHLSLALQATVISYGGANILFTWAAQQFTRWRVDRTEWIFRSGLLVSPWVLLIALGAGFTAVRTRTFWVPTFVSIFLLASLMPMYAWSGPGDLLNAVMPLISLNAQLTFLAFLTNMLFLYLWVSPWKDKASRRAAPPIVETKLDPR